MRKIYLFFLFLTSCLLGMAQNETAPDGYYWSENMISNPDFSTSDLSAYECRGESASMRLVTKNGKKALEVTSGDFKEQSWDHQFFVTMNAPMHEGEKFYLSFTCMADRKATYKTETQSAPGQYNHWYLTGDVNFNTNWTTYEWNITLSAEQAGNDGFRTIAIHLNYNQEMANKVYFSNFVVKRLIPKNTDNTGLTINEIQAANNDLFIDPSLNYGGWIEVYNPGDAETVLGGLYVSDDPSNPKKFRLPTEAGSVPAHGFKNIWFDHNSADGSYSSKAKSQVRFKLDVEGGTIILSDKYGKPMQSIDYPPATPRCSFARTRDGGSEWGTTSSPTPEKSNATSRFATERLTAPVVSHDGGVFDMGEEVNIHVEIPEGTSLRYTKDGTTPTATNGGRSLTGNFTVNNTTVFRFCLVQEGKLTSPVVTRSFIFRNHDYYLPVLSIATKPDNLFDDEIGIYVRGVNGGDSDKRGQDVPCNWNRDWERPVNIEYMVPERNTEGGVSYLTKVNQEVSMEICGGWSRGFSGGTTDGRTWEAKSSFRLKTSKAFEGINEMPFAVFPDKPYNKYKAWQVRNGGNDELHRSKDPILQQLVLSSGIDIDCQDYQPCHVFLNGQYLGMLNIREASNKQYGYSNFGIDTDDMDQFENWHVLKEGDAVAWNDLQSRASRLASSRSAKDYEAVKELLDVDEFINYMAVQCYFGGSDWMPNTNNIKYYRSRSDGGRFRYVLFDVDSAFDLDNHSMFNDVADGRTGGGETGKLFRNLLKYEPFRSQFLDVMCLVEGSIFEYNRSQEMAQRIYDNTTTALFFEEIDPYDEWLLNQLKTCHKGVVVNKMASHSLYNLSNPYWLKLSSNTEAGQLLLNGLKVPTGKFDGRVYDYAGRGIQLVAQAPAGYRFLNWTNQGGRRENMKTLIAYASQWDYYDQGSMDGKDWTSPDFDAAGNGWKTDRKAPFGYGNSGSYPQNNSNTRLDYGGNSSNKRPTYYFRTRFYVEHQPQADDVYRLDYQIDDGFAFYINGKYAGGFRMTEADAGYNFVTTDYAGGEPDQGTIEFASADIHQGWNTLAVEVHNNSYTSSDIFWDGSLRCMTHTEVEPSIVGTSPTLCLSDLEVGSYDLQATYEPIANIRQRYEAGGTPVRINEVSAGNDIYINDYHKKNDWVELYNTTDEDIDLTGLYLSDNAKKPQKWQIGSTVANTIIPAHSTRIVWCDELEPISQLHAPFKLDNADGAMISIQAADGTWEDRMTYLSQPRWQTYGRYPDGGNFTTLLGLPTIDKSNQYGTLDLANYDPAADDESAITLALAEGWNWTSHNLAEDINMLRFSYFAQEFRSQTKQSIYNEELGWQGDLKNISMTKGYKMQMRQATDITLRGQLYDTSLPVSLQAGWNWLGVPLRNATALTAALEHLTPSEGDQIVGLEGFAIYEDGAWRGSLTKLEPGLAYLFKVGQAQDLKWNDLSQGQRIRERRYISAQREDMAPWNFNLHAYPNVMTMVARLETDGLDLTQGYYLGAFCEDECRGVAKMEDDLLCLNIHGEGGENIQFRLLDAEGNEYVSEEKEAMVNLELLGSFGTPYLLHFNAGNVEDVIRDTMATSGRIVSVQYFNLSGQRISQPEGICIQRTQMSDGTVRVKKIKG